MSEKKNLPSEPDSLMSKDDKDKMSFNVYDQMFISRVLDFHYGSIISEIFEKVVNIIDVKYEEQTKVLAQVIMENHSHHMREIDRLIDMIDKTDEKANRLMIKFNCHEKEIRKLKAIIEEMHHIKIDSK